MNDWQKRSNGNWIKKINGILCTVYSKDKKGWTYVHDGIFSQTMFTSAQQAMIYADQVLW